MKTNFYKIMFLRYILQFEIATRLDSLSRVHQYSIHSNFTHYTNRLHIFLMNYISILSYLSVRQRNCWSQHSLNFVFESWNVFFNWKKNNHKIIIWSSESSQNFTRMDKITINSNSNNHCKCLIQKQRKVKYCRNLSLKWIQYNGGKHD